MNLDRPVVIVAGAASRDLVSDDPRGWRLGGAVCYASLALARFGFEARAVVGADREAAGAHELDLLRSAGVSVATNDLASGPVFDNIRHVLHSTADRVPLTALPRRWTSGFDGVLFTPVAAELGDDWAALAAGVAGPAVGLGWQGLLRHLAAGDLVRPATPVSSVLVRSARLVVVSREDVVPGTRPENLVPLLNPAARLGWTEGTMGGIVLGRDEPDGRIVARRYPAIPSSRVVDQTGAGDVFLAAWLAATIRPSIAEPYDPVIFASAAGSLAVEGPGLAGVPDLAAVRDRMTLAPSLASRRPSADSSRTSGRPSQA
ncbi:MAG TPA: PfkB family carbohydrate kinase [Candidatus Limnocylindria bacterium]|nr:PfkB family carbohydrate kinase [Candidatus Limnocylindria bacterium]